MFSGEAGRLGAEALRVLTFCAPRYPFLPCHHRPGRESGRTWPCLLTLCPQTSGEGSRSRGHVLRWLFEMPLYCACFSGGGSFKKDADSLEWCDQDHTESELQAGLELRPLESQVRALPAAAQVSPEPSEGLNVCVRVCV